MNFDEEYKKSLEKHKIIPEAVVENRWKEKKYVPELSWNGFHYILSDPMDSHEAAMAHAESKVAELRTILIRSGKDFVKGYRIAKE